MALSCPRCAPRDVSLQARSARAVTAHGCESCGGLWVDQQQLQAARATRRPSAHPVTPRGAPRETIGARLTVGVAELIVEAIIQVIGGLLTGGR